MMIIQFFQIKITAKRFWSCLLLCSFSILYAGESKGIFKNTDHSDGEDMIDIECKIEYTTIMSNIKNTNSFSGQNILYLQQFLARAFVDGETNKLREILKNLQNKASNPLLTQELFTQNGSFLNSVFCLYEAKIEQQKELIEENKNMNSKSNAFEEEVEKWQKEEDQKFLENWKQLTNELDFTPSITPKAFLGCSQCNSEELFDQFIKIGEDQHASDENYWLNGDFDFLYQFLYKFYLDDHHSTLSVRIKEKVMGKINSDPTKGIDVLAKNNYSEDQYAPTAFALLCYKSPKDAEQYVLHLQERYKKDKQDTLKEILDYEKSGVPAGKRSTNQDHLDTYIINCLKEKPTIQYLNLSLSRDKQVDIDTYIKWEAEEDKLRDIHISKDNALMGALTVKNKNLIDQLFGFDGIHVNNRHIGLARMLATIDNNDKNQILLKLALAKEMVEDKDKDQEKIKNLENEKQVLTNQANQLNQIINSQKDKIKALENENEDKLRDKENEVSQLKQTINNQKAEINNLKNEENKTKNTLIEKENQVKQLEKQLKEEEKKLEQLRDSVTKGEVEKQLKKDLENAENKVKDLTEQLTNKDTVLANLNNQKNELEEKINQLNNESQNNDTTGLTQANQILTQEKEALTQKVTSLEKKLEETKAATAILQFNHDQLKQERDNLKNKKPTEGDNINDLKTQIKTIETAKYKFKAYAWISSIVIIIMASVIGFLYRATEQKN